MIDFEKLADMVQEAQYKEQSNYRPRTQRDKLRALSEEFGGRINPKEKQLYPVEDDSHEKGSRFGND